MGNYSFKPIRVYVSEPFCSESFCSEPLKNVWYLDGYYTETGEPILPEPLEPEYVPRKPKIFCKDSDFCDLDKPSLSPKFKGKLTPLKLF